MAIHAQNQKAKRSPKAIQKQTHAPLMGLTLTITSEITLTTSSIIATYLV